MERAWRFLLQRAEPGYPLWRHIRWRSIETADPGAVWEKKSKKVRLSATTANQWQREEALDCDRVTNGSGSKEPAERHRMDQMGTD